MPAGVDGLPELTDAQRAVADARAHTTAEVAAAQAGANPNGFVSLRDVRWSAEQVGLAGPDHDAERHVFRDAGFGRLKTGGQIGEWQLLVCAAEEAARFHAEPIDLRTVSRMSLAWCLADRPDDHPIAALDALARDIGMDDVHDESLRPSYRRLLDGWRALLAAGA